MKNKNEIMAEEMGKIIEEEVNILIEEGDIAKENLKTFKDFWEEIDTINFYEEDWKKNKKLYKKFFKIAYKKIKSITCLPI